MISNNIEEDYISFPDARTEDGRFDEHHYEEGLSSATSSASAQTPDLAQSLPWQTSRRLKQALVSVGSGQFLQVYKVWPGKSQFLCDGFCMTGPFTCASFCTVGCILAPFTVYCIVVLPLAMSWHPLVPLSCIAIFVVTMTLLLATCCSDPGVIPRRAVILASETGSDLCDALGYNVLGDGDPAHDSQTDGQNMVPDELKDKGYRWCRTCEIVRPPRASHCPDCDQCVLRFDHHCPFVNNCVAQRNYHFFVGFTASTTCLACCVIPPLFWWATMHGGVLPKADEGTDDSKSGASGASDVVGWLVVVLAAIVGAVSLVLLGFLGYHFFLITTRRTTKEHVKRSARALTEAAEPTFFASRGPRLFNPRALISLDAWEAAGGRRGSLFAKSDIPACVELVQSRSV